MEVGQTQRFYKHLHNTSLDTYPWRISLKGQGMLASRGLVDSQTRIVGIITDCYALRWEFSLVWEQAYIESLFGGRCWFIRTKSRDGFYTNLTHGFRNEMTPDATDVVYIQCGIGISSKGSYHILSVTAQCWARPPMPFGIIRPQLVNSLRHTDAT